MLRRKLAAGGLVALLAMAGLGGPTFAQDAGKSEEVRQWAKYYWHLVETGQPHPDAEKFKFSEEALNQPGSFPLTGALVLFRGLYADALDPVSADCTARDVFDLIHEDEKVFSELRTYTTEGTLGTPLGEKAAESHLMALEKGWLADGDYSLSGSYDSKDGVLVSEGLEYLGTGSADSATPEKEEAVSEEVRDLGKSLQETAAKLGEEGVTGLADPLALIAGKTPDDTPIKEALESIVFWFPGSEGRTFAALIGNDRLVNVYRIDLEGYFYIFDPAAAAVLGPYDAKSAMPGADLAALHGAAPGTAVKLAAAIGGCAALAPKIPPTPGPVPGVPLPPAPPGTPGWAPIVPPGWVPTPPGLGGVVGGGYTCYTTPTGGGGVNCLCSRQQDYRRNRGTRCFLWVWPCWTVWQYARETETCSWTGGPGTACVPPPPPGSCSISHQIW